MNSCYTEGPQNNMGEDRRRPAYGEESPRGTSSPLHTYKNSESTKVNMRNFSGRLFQPHSTHPLLWSGNINNGKAPTEIRIARVCIVLKARSQKTLKPTLYSKSSTRKDDSSAQLRAKRTQFLNRRLEFTFKSHYTLSPQQRHVLVVPS